MNAKPDAQAGSLHHVLKVQGMLTPIIDHMREDIPKMGDPRAQALFETAAEVLTGLVTALEHYQQKSEPAWRREAV